jgi:ATP-binding cassette, subfamily C, bacterial
MMSEKVFVWKNFTKFLGFQPGKLSRIFVYTIILAFTQSVGYLLLIPVLRHFDTGHHESGHRFIRALEKMEQKLNFSLSFEWLLLAFILILCLVFLLQNRKSVLQNSYQHNFSGFIRKDFYRKILFSDWIYLTQFSKTQHMQTLTSEIPRVTNFYFYMLSAITKLVILTVLFVLAFIISFRLALIVLILGAVQFIFLSGYLKKSYELGLKGRKSYREMLKIINEFWITLKPAKIHNTEKFYFRSFEKADDQFVRNQIQQYSNNQRPQLIYSILGVLNLVVIVYICLQFQVLSIPFLIVFILIFSRIVPLFVNTFNDINQIFLNADSLLKTREMKFPDHTSFIEQSNTTDFSLQKIINLNDISFSYSQNNQVLNGFSAEIHAFSITGITGKSGSGKTTLIDLMSGLIQPDKGKILFDEFEMTSSNAAFLRKAIAYLPQESLFIDGSIRENLVWDAEFNFSDEEIFKMLDQVNATEILKIKNLDIDNEVINFKYNFSGGELQRLALARVMLRKPQILMLDEATSALDEKNEDVIVSVLHELKKTTTILFVTHKRRLLDSFDHIIDLDNH